MSDDLLLLSAILLGGAHVVVSLLVAPPAEGFVAPLSQRLFYFHVPSAWVGYLAFAVTVASSILYLQSRDLRFDRLALSSAEIGVVFSVSGLGTGLLWSRVEFAGFRPLEDPKFLTLVVLIFSYIGYFLLRSRIEEAGERARLAAVFGIFAGAGIPLSYLSSRVSVHPDFASGSTTLSPELGLFLLEGVVAFTVLYVALLRVRIRIEKARSP